MIWYLSDAEWPEPNMELLNNALQQTGWAGKPLSEASWRAAVGKRLRSVSYENLVEDVMPFLGPDANPEGLAKENIIRLLKNKP
ncbi:MAG: hypothetical protein A2V52_06195 [Actinobacteria bacterium RBG_19FT_COMBO_54_7]|uniref:Uncharacterized protein n=1 Tax=Candidatus Solincola sediminis TaxID=1797199 RepID=A0A1F2WRD2_9ACTN|nr:MAG: hypothetical protein A2Y75_11230 [Candidatus Solincola sediminis]OFW60229.1 MAG: hypothetical protein A2W01_08830 [Candidatus Solincola sediminis]OFW70404.1 MAG: hypothetical protein A2V52_06195 [Actinobacteria bacterium RBG_19FT_COMBO_54_7]